MSRKLLLLFLTLGAIVLAGAAACGGGDDDDDDDDDGGGFGSAATNKDNNDSKDSKDGKDSQNSDKYGSVKYKFSGNVEAEGELPFVPAASFYSRGAWTLTFGKGDGEAVLSINLLEETRTILFGDGKVTVTGIAAGDDAACTIKVDSQSASGAKGSFECKDAGGIGKSGALFTDGVKATGTFDAKAK